MSDLPADATMAAALRRHGYLVVKIPACKKTGQGHGSHTLITRTAMCDGEEPKPHGLASSHLGTFGMWCYCACGRGFADYTLGDPEPTPWEEHMAATAPAAKDDTDD